MKGKLILPWITNETPEPLVGLTYPLPTAHFHRSSRFLTSLHLFSPFSQSSRETKAASHVLQTVWSYKELRNALTKDGWNKSHFQVHNSKGTRDKILFSMVMQPFAVVFHTLCSSSSPQWQQLLNQPRTESRPMMTPPCPWWRRTKVPACVIVWMCLSFEPNGLDVVWIMKGIPQSCD